MELIYAYIGKYRTFKNQGITFSDKFHVSYDNERKKLTIERNPNYFDFYPGNIVGVSAILGKNATGKSSLLDLIGEKVWDRKKNAEIWEQRHSSDPHKKNNICKLFQIPEDSLIVYSQEDNYKNHYFLIYYYGKNAENQDLYIFESDAPYLYMAAFNNPTKLKSLEYYAGKGWISFVFLRNGNFNQILEDTQNYSVKAQELQTNISIIRFLRQDYRNVFDREQLNQEENEVISVRRRYASLNNLYLYNQIDFLIENMKKRSRMVHMYFDDHYTVNIHFSGTDTFFDKLKSTSYDKTEVIPDYRDLISDSMEEEKKIVLAVLWHYTCFLFQTILHPEDKLTKDDPRKLLLNNMYEINRDVSLRIEYAQAKDLYHQNILLLLENDPDREYRNFTFSDISIIRAEKALENFLENASACSIAYKYTQNQLSFTISKDTELDKDLHSVKSFFDDFLDEPIRKNMEQTDSLLGGFFKTDIQFFSDGEKENLAMFTSIDEQIRENYAYKTKYILLFDEIERSLHPELCRNLVSNLVVFFQQYYPEKEFQIIIASHSPFIVGDIQRENIVLLERSSEISNVAKPQQSSFGQNIHTILKAQFFLDSTFGAYTQTVIGELEKWLTKQIDDSVTKQINTFLQGAIEHRYEKTYLTSIEETIRFLQTVIDNIGEPVLKNYFQRLLNRQKKSPASRDMMIQYYERQLEELRSLKQQDLEQAEVKRYD